MWLLYRVRFKLLLTHGRANIWIHYEDGTIKTKEWDAENMTAKSNVIGNLRSRPEFRQGEWQKNKIKKVEVSVNY